MALQDTLETISTLTDQNRRLWRLVVILIGAVVVLPLATAASCYVMLSKPGKYFRSTPDGRIVEMIPLGTPFASRGAILSFAYECTVKAYSLNHVQWRSQVGEASQCFTKDGFAQYQQALSDSGNLDRIKADKLVQTAYASGPGVVSREGIEDKVYRWEVQHPITISYETSGRAYAQSLIAEIGVTRVDTTETPLGYAIRYIRLRPFNSSRA